MKQGILAGLWMMLLGFSLLSCAGKAPHPPWLFTIISLGPHLGPEEIFELPVGDPISFSQLIEKMNRSQVLFVGESHDQYEHHQNQVRILRALLKEGREIVVAMEMFQRSQQPVLDRWGQGSLTEDEFLKEIQWETTWGMDYGLYKGILDTVRERRLKLLGLNIPRELIRKTAEAGIINLSPEDRSRLPQLDLSDQDHRRYIESIYESHREGAAKSFENFYQAQCLWDEAMAEVISDFLNSPEGRGKTVVVFAGNGHVAFDFGVPNRLHRRVTVPYQTIVLKEWKKTPDEDLLFSKAPRPIADFLWITKPTPPERKRPKIGIILKEAEGLEGIRIERVIPGSPAESAGLLPGDQIVSIDGKEMKSLMDIHDAVAPKGWGREISIILLRNGKKKELTVTLPFPKD